MSDDLEFVKVSNLEQAMNAAQQCPPRAIIVNSVTPEDAWSTAKAASNTAPGTPIIGCSVPQTEARAVAAGALGHLVKPITRSDLETAIQAVGSPVKRVLVVDDDPDILNLLTRLLWLCDGTIEVATAEDGEQALSKIQQGAPDLLLLDISLPDTDGWQVLEAVRNNPDSRTLPAFFVSAQDPAQQPLTSSYLLATMDERVPLHKLLVGTLQMSEMLLSSDAELYPMPG
jgi:CheY-like chemotaxis protein